MTEEKKVVDVPIRKFLQLTKGAAEALKEDNPELNGIDVNSLTSAISATLQGVLERDMLDLGVRINLKF